MWECSINKYVLLMINGILMNQNIITVKFDYTLDEDFRLGYNHFYGFTTQSMFLCSSSFITNQSFLKFILKFLLASWIVLSLSFVSMAHQEEKIMKQKMM